MLGDNEAAQATLQATETVETGTCNAKYTQSLEDRLELASLLEAAETKANTLICDIRLIKAEVDALRKIILDSGNGAAIKLMPPPSVLSAFVSGPAPSASSLILNGSGQIASANSEYDDATKEEDADEYNPNAPSRRLSRSRMSSSSGTATFDPSLQKTMPSPQSMNQSPSAVTRTSNGLISTTTAAAASAGRIQGSTPLPTFTPTASSTTTTTTTASATRKYSTSHTHDHLTSPLPPNSLAWTDIIRTRYPNFQRSTVQTSKHAREFIETRKIPFYRVTPTHSLGRSKPTYAIPPALQKDFVEYFEEKFGALGVLGKKRVGGGQGGFDGSETASMCGEGGGAAANLQGPSYDNGGDAVAAEDGGVMMEDVEQQLEQQQFDGSKGKRKSPSSGASSSNGAVSANGIASSAGKKRLVKEEDSPVVVESMDGVAKSRGGRVVVSKGGLALIRYNTIVSKMMPDFKTLPTDARLAIKRGVKQFLQHEMGDDFSECLMKTPSDNGQVPKPTYGIPEHLVPGFQQWVYVELKKCFPERVVLSPPSEV